MQQYLVAVKWVLAVRTLFAKFRLPHLTTSFIHKSVNNNHDISTEVYEIVTIAANFTTGKAT
jgi:hypothetical protein